MRIPKIKSVNSNEFEIKTIIHIGIQRTGTTFLQREIFPKTDIRYISPEFFRRGDIGTLAEYYYYILQEDTLISNENIYCDMWNKKDTRFERMDILNKLFPQAKIIFGIRNKSSLKHSWYKKSVWLGATWSYPAFLRQINANIFEYEPYIDQLRDLFSGVYVYRYEDFQENPENIVNEICHFIGVTMPEIEPSAFKRKWNRGYTNRQMSIACTLNNIFKTKMNPNGIFPIPHKWHPHRLLFQSDLNLRLNKGKDTKLLPVYNAKK